MLKFLCIFLVTFCFVHNALAIEETLSPVEARLVREQATLSRIQDLLTESLNSLDEDDLENAFGSLGQAHDLSVKSSLDVQPLFVQPTSAFYRRFANLRFEEKYELLLTWTMPNDSRSHVRSLSLLLPTDAPPVEFARLLGERPREYFFAVPDVQHISGVFSTGWLLIQAAEESAHLRELIVELRTLADENVPGSRDLLLLAEIVENDSKVESAIAQLQTTMDILQRRQFSSDQHLAGVHSRKRWQFGYTPVDSNRDQVDITPYPYWSGTQWRGREEYPDTDSEIGWSRVDQAGGHAGASVSPVRRWIIPADGELSVYGRLKHVSQHGDGIWGRIYLGGNKQMGEWTTRVGETVTSLSQFPVSAGQSLDFVVDPGETNSWDVFTWEFMLTLTTADGEKIEFNSANIDISPDNARTVDDLVLALACLKQDWTHPFGENIVQTYGQAVRASSLSPATSHFLQQVIVAVAKQTGIESSEDVTGFSLPQHWGMASAATNLQSRMGGSQSTFAYEQHLAVLSGANEFLYFRYPLSGNFRFECEFLNTARKPGFEGVFFHDQLGSFNSQLNHFVFSDLNGEDTAFKPCPFLRRTGSEDSQHVAIQSEAQGGAILINGHPLAKLASNEAGFLGLKLDGSSSLRIRNASLSGTPVIPRQVSLLANQSLSEWQSFSESDAPHEEPEDLGSADWAVEDGLLLHEANDGAQTKLHNELLQFRRPLFNAETIKYEFYYKAGKTEIHPALGRHVFLIEPNGVRLHWITSPDSMWTGLKSSNTLIEPLQRRGPRQLPLKENDWNEVQVAYAENVATVTLNGVDVYERELPDQNPQFGLFHQANVTTALARNISLSGNWPQTLSEVTLADPFEADEALETPFQHQFLNRILNEDVLSANIRHVSKSAQAASTDEERFQQLAKWVLPAPGRNTLRVNGLFYTPEANSDSSDLSMTNDLGHTVANQARRHLNSPAVQLVKVAQRLGRLAELRETLADFSPPNEFQERAKLSLLYLIALADENWSNAFAAVDELVKVNANRTEFTADSLWPEVLVLAHPSQNPKVRATTAEVRWRLYDWLLRRRLSGSGTVDNFIAALIERPEFPDMAERQLTRNWIPASLQNETTFREGRFPSIWNRRGTTLENVVSHGTDCLFYRLPLQGDFEVECEMHAYFLHLTGIMYAGRCQLYHFPLTFQNGTLKETSEASLSPELHNEGEVIRVRLTVRDGVCQTYFNDRMVNSFELPVHHDPWLGFYTNGCNTGGISDVKISGEPIIPEKISIFPDADFSAWHAWYLDDLGSQPTADTQWHLSAEDSEVLESRKLPALSGANRESLLYYHRPVAEDGEIEYQFFHVPEETTVHPAIGRVAYLLSDQGVRLHHINQVESTARAAENEVSSPATIPLKENAWNDVRLEFRDAAFTIKLNKEVIYHGRLDDTTGRHFGLFHFADQTSVLVRNITFRGDWPRSLPPIEEQELADQFVVELNQERDRFPSAFDYNFSDSTNLNQHFKLVEPTGTDRVFAPDGLVATMQANGRWISHTLIPRFSVSGDYDMEVDFDELSLRGDETAGILMYAEHDDSDRPVYRVMRMKEREIHQRLHASYSLLHNDGQRSFTTHEKDSSDATSGRLRLARRGDQIHYLYAHRGSSIYRLIGSKECATTDSVEDGIHIQAIGNGDARVSVAWKSFSIRAEKIRYFPSANAPAKRRLLVMNLDGSNFREVTPPPNGFANLGSPEWSRDGQRIAFDATTSQFRDSHIFITNLDGSQVVNCGPGAMPSFSADGKQLLISQSGSGIVIMNADGTNRESIAPRGWGGQWAPNGKQVAWGERGNVIIMDVESKKQQTLFSAEQAQNISSTYWNPGWSHDSRSIALKVRNRRTNEEEIVVADVGNPESFQTLLRPARTVQVDFAFTQSNRKVVCCIHNPAHKGPQLYELNRDQPGVQKLIPNQPDNWNITNCAISPDGQKIAFTGTEILGPVDWGAYRKSLKF